MIRAALLFEAATEATTTMRLAWGIVAVLLILWLLGIGFHIAGGLIHVLLVVAFVVLIIDLLSGRRAA